MTRNPLAPSLPQALAQNSPRDSGPSNPTLLSTGVRATLGRVPMVEGIVPRSLPPPGFDNRLASRWQAPKISTARGPALVDAQQTLFAALKTAARRRAG